MSSDNAHDASAQSLGYYYQSLLGLYLLLVADDECSVCIEKFDDVSIDDSSSKTETFVQSKCHTASAGSLYDTSTDLWRTIKCWSDYLAIHPETVDKTLFLIITNSSFSKNSIAEFLKSGSPQMKKAYARLMQISTSKSPNGNVAFYQSFLGLDETLREKMVFHISILCDSPDISGLLVKIKKIIRYSVAPKDVDTTMSNLVGWWYEKVIRCLLSPSPLFIRHIELENFFSTARRNSEEELPLTINYSSPVSKEEFNAAIDDSHNFCAQLSLIQATNRHIQLCMNDFCHAFQQRSDWVRTGLEYIPQLEKYDDQLVDQWKRLFARMEEDLNRGSVPASEEEKIKCGSELLRKIEDLSICVDPKRTEKFIMCGSYQMLVNALRVGWHVDFQKRLK